MYFHISVLCRCNYDLGVQWSRQVGHSVFVSPPTLSDVNLDGILDIVAVPFTDDVTVIDTHSGATIPHTVWPRVIPTTSYHSSPIMVCMCVCVCGCLGAWKYVGMCVCVSRRFLNSDG